MRTRTLAELRAEVRQRADVEGDPHVSDAEITRLINQSAALVFHNRLALIAPKHWPRLDVTLTTVANQKTLTPPIPFYKILHLWWERSSTDKQPLHAIELGDVWRIDAERGWQAEQPVYYIAGDALGNSITFYPTPKAIHTIKGFYVPPYVDLSLDGDTLNGISGWEEVVVVDAAIKILRKQDRDARPLMADKAELLKDLEASLNTQHAGEPGYVRDVEGTPEEYR